MTNQERAEKIVSSICVPGTLVNSNLLKLEITYQLDQAQRDVLMDTPLWILREEERKKQFKEGFAAAREKAVGILEREGASENAEKILKIAASIIRQMEP